MKLSSKKVYFLRGFGVGMVVVSIICAFIPHNMSESQIKSAAKELGMVEVSEQEGKLQSIINDENTPSATPKVVTAKPTPTKAPNKTEKPKATSKTTYKPTSTNKGVSSRPTATGNASEKATSTPKATVKSTRTR